ncbi:MAG: hypothetical protein QE485_18505 [Acidovorax sp.]|uniref:hypothetical protein n=1 Tax=Acidovorax sp. TaxID=1872122 RepID=UPI00260D9756|nr:hypothetical protein [Acidovorax sp.]MDH4419207.1 hypothetical protein [Acidovorax sp.]
MSQLTLLIEKAASIAGSEYKLAKTLHMPQPTISQWKAGTRRCSPTDRAALADIAGANPAEEAIEAVIEGIDLETPKGQRAKEALMKALENIRKL